MTNCKALIFAYICGEFRERGNDGSLFLFTNLEKVDFNLIKDLLADKFLEIEFNDCYLIDVEFSKSRNKLEVFIDSDSGFGFDKCKKISRFLENYLDQNGELGEKYILEVSSPGLNRPLKMKRQYVKNIGRNARVDLMDGEKLEGKISDVNNNEITLMLNGNTTTVTMEMVKSIKILASFK